jgi:hypothetical protein
MRVTVAASCAAAVSCGGSGGSSPVGTPCEGLGLFKLTLERGTLEIGQVTQGNVIARGCGGTSISIASLSWETSRPEIAAFGPDNEIVAVSAGSAQISAKLKGETATATLSVIEPTPPAPPPPGGMSVQIFSPVVGAVVDDSVRVLASVLPQGPLSRVEGTLGPKQFTLSVMYVGMGAQPVWNARVRVNDLAAGNYKIVVRAFNTAGVSAADSVVFERRLLNTGGTGTGASGNKMMAPPTKQP